MQPSPYRRLRHALALRRARRATVDGRFPRRPGRAVGVLEAALGHAGREDRVALLEGIAALHAESARRDRDVGAAARAVEALHRALPDAGPDEAVVLAQLAEAQETLHAMSDGPGLLREAVATARHAADRAPADPLTRIMVLSSVAGVLLRAGSDLDDPRLFEEVVAVVEDSLAAGGGSALHLAQAHRLRYEHDGDAATLARAEAAARDAVTRCEEHGLDAADEYAELAQVLRYRADRSGDPGLAREAAAAAREALDRTAEDDEEHAKRACLLAGALTECHYAGDPGALAEAVAVVRSVTAAATVPLGPAHDSGPPRTPAAARSTGSVPEGGRSDVWQVAAAVLCAWADQHEDADVAQEADRTARTALALAGDDEGQRAVALDTLADVLRRCHLLSEDPQVLDEAIAHGEAAASLGTGPPGDRAGRVGNLGVLLLLRHEGTGAPADLDAAVDRFGEALALLGDEHPDARIHLNNLGSALAARTRLHGSDDELDEAIAAGRAALRGDGPAHQRVLRLSNLGGALYARYARDGVLADLDEDIDLQRMALLLAPSGHPDRPGLLSNLATALSERHEALGVRGDLTEAVQLLEEVMATGPSPRRLATVAGAHGLALHALHQVSGDQDVLDRALVSLSTAVRATAPTDAQLPLQLANLVGALTTASARRPAAATEAVDAARGALAALDEGRSATAVRGSLLLALAARSGTGDLDEAVALARRVVADTAPDDPDLGRRLSNLAYVLNLRHESTGGPEDVTEARGALRAAARARTGPADVRLHAARAWGRLAALAGDGRAAAEAFALGVALLPTAIPRRLERPDAQRRLAEAAGLASDAAALCLACGDPERALALLELGRGVLLNRRSGMRAELADLYDTDRELAERFEELGDALDRLDHPPMPLPVPPPDTTAGGPERERRRDLEAELDVVVRAIRALPGQAGFQRPPSVTSLLAEAAHGPVVVVNVSEYRCDALLLTAGGLRHLPLDDLEADDLESTADQFHSDVMTALDPRATQEAVDTADERVARVLDLLWRAVAAPVLAELRVTDPDTRIWWVPTGALSRLPLHAATAADDPSRSLVDRTVSSYTPTVTALHHARARGPAPRRRVATVVHADVTRPGLPGLPAARREARAAADHLGVEPLDLAECERSVLIDALTTCTHLHLALHAVADQEDPGTSRFLLPDLDLTFAEIAARRGGWGRLAYLSACETTRTPPGLADEAIHLTSAFLLVGFSGVIGTLWRVPDAVAETTALTFYEALDRVRDDPAVALARAARQVRLYYADAPAAWAAHHHVGV